MCLPDTRCILFVCRFFKLLIYNNKCPDKPSKVVTLHNIITYHVQVDSLIQQVAEEHGLEMTDKLADAATAPTDSIATTSSVSAQQEDALNRRLAQLRN